ncbi:mobilization protein [Pseudomonas aeruginosa]|nr:mobilization protein [Pseudomonas aeruginosa]
MRIEVGPKKELVKRGMQPMKDSELVHAFLERVITSLEVGASGAIVQRED